MLQCYVTNMLLCCGNKLTYLLNNITKILRDLVQLLRDLIRRGSREIIFSRSRTNITISHDYFIFWGALMCFRRCTWVLWLCVVFLTMCCISYNIFVVMTWWWGALCVLWIWNMGACALGGWGDPRVKIQERISKFHYWIQLFSKLIWQNHVGANP